MVTVGELRKAIAGLPDDAVVLRYEDELDDAVTADRVVVGAMIATAYKHRRGEKRGQIEWLGEQHDAFSETPDTEPGAAIRSRPAVAIE